MNFRSLTPDLKPHQRIILAYDKPTFTEADKALLKALVPHIGMVKVGMEAMSSRLPGGTTVALQVVEFLESINASVMWDGKFKDITNTVRSAIRSLTRRVWVWPIPIKIATIHATMRMATLVAALEASKDTGMLVAGVTLLTDHENSDALKIYNESPDEVVLFSADRMRQASAESGVPAGVVCAPKDLFLIRKLNIIKITPNIREKDAPADDQNKSRSMTAAEAIEAGADYLVIGRPIMRHTDPVAAAQAIAQQIASAL